MTDNFKDIWSLRKPGSLDSSRHKQRIRDAIKKNLHDLIAEENIISSKGGKKVKVPIKYLDMWKFKFGKNDKQKGVGHGDGEPGDIIAKENPGQGQGQGGQDPGEDVYEEEVELEEVIEMMLEDLDLPWLDKKDKSVEIETEDIVFQDIAERGLPSNIDRKQTVMRNIRKNAAKGKIKIGNFEPSDLRYRVWEQIVEKHSNAAVFLLMDRSGSMTSEKKYIVKSFFWWMVKFLERKYDNVELIFIAHDTEAKETEEENFFAISQSGGTMVSSAFILANKIIEDRFPESIWNNYVFSFSDGDNWPEDNSRCVQSIKNILPHCQAVGYGEVNLTKDNYGWSRLTEVFSEDSDLVKNERFIVASIEKREDIYKTLKEFLPNEDKGK